MNFVSCLTQAVSKLNSFVVNSGQIKMPNDMAVSIGKVIPIEFIITHVQPFLQEGGRECV